MLTGDFDGSRRNYFFQRIGCCDVVNPRSSAAADEAWGTRHFIELPAGGDHLGGVLEAGFGDLCAGEHAGYFVGAGAVVEEADLGFGAAVGFALFDDEVLVGEGGDLRAGG